MRKKGREGGESELVVSSVTERPGTDLLPKLGKNFARDFFAKTE
jgi:hypothetical protein